MISLENVSAYYDTKKAVDDICLILRPGRITGIIGPNGAGKSTLIKAMVGLHERYSGDIYFGEKHSRKERSWIKQHCGYAPEDAELLPYLTGREFLELLATLYGIEEMETRIEYYLELSGLKTSEAELVLGYSHGMRQKLLLAGAMIGNPDYLILDEALNGLDPVALFKTKKHLQKQVRENKTILITSHIIPLIREWCDPVIIMHQGKVIGEYSQQQINQLERDHRTTFEEHFVTVVTDS